MFFLPLLENVLVIFSEFTYFTNLEDIKEFNLYFDLIK